MGQANGGGGGGRYTAQRRGAHLLLLLNLLGRLLLLCGRRGGLVGGHNVLLRVELHVILGAILGAGKWRGGEYNQESCNNEEAARHD